MPRKIGYHRPAGQPDADRLYRRQARRMENNRFYKRAAWLKLRAAYLAEHPLCEDCGRALAEHVHHVEPRERRPDLELSWDNLRALCQPCHNAQEIR